VCSCGVGGLCSIIVNVVLKMVVESSKNVHKSKRNIICLHDFTSKLNIHCYE